MVVQLSPKMPSSPLVAIRNLTHSFGVGPLCRQVLSGINLTIQAGEIVILAGPSGSGKTSLLTLVGGLRSVQSGSLRVFGQELNGATEEQRVQIRRQIGYVFQAHNLLQSLTALQNVQMSIQLQGRSLPQAAWLQAEAALTAVGLAQWLQTYPDQLSGGQKQRVAIARALVCRPQLLLADEPTAALDSKSGREIVELMQRLVKERGCSVLMVTHDNRIMDVADRIIHLEDGQLVTGDNSRTYVRNNSNKI